MNCFLSDILLNPKKIYYPLFKVYNEYMQGKNSFNPWSIEIHPTARCNHNCIHCSYKQRNESRKFLSQDAMQNLIKSIINMKIKGVYFSGGGEPCVYPNLKQYMVQLLDNNVDLALITNGDMLEKSGVIDIADRLNYIAISVPSCDRNLFKHITGIDSLYDVISMPKKIKAKFINTKVILGARVVITNLIVNELENILFTLKDSQFDYVLFKVVRDYEDRGLGIDNLAVDKLQNVIKKLVEKGEIDRNFTNLESIFEFRNESKFQGTCYINEMGLIANITPEGDVYPNIVEIGQDKFKIGNINNECLEKIWNSEQHYNVKINSKIKWNNKECKNCRAICYNDIINNIISESITRADPFI